MQCLDMVEIKKKNGLYICYSIGANFCVCVFLNNYILGMGGYHAFPHVKVQIAAENITNGE